MSKLKNFGFKLIAVFTLVLIGVGNLAFAGKSNNTLTWTTDRDLDVALPYYNNTREVVVMSYMGWDTLLFRNPKTFEYEPLLATSYKWVDTVTLEFDLRNDVTFHNGKKFSADDVVYTFNHVASEESGVLTRRNVNWIKNAERLGDYKVRINLLKPFPAALEYLAGPTPIFPVGFWEKAPIAGSKKDFGAVNPVNSGTGPYKITKVVPGESVHFELNKNYFKGAKGKSSIGKIVFRIISDPEAQIAELITGGVDWIWDVSKDKAE
ncbi:MAG TPA: ABC transporter substrate-binding protein, partial [Deltaproteobacteria bacterium]|nr:ABC transporter substrate-binding protein [Deltaproteobacteria bacterium]